jgi:hypothetical protein
VGPFWSEFISKIVKNSEAFLGLFTGLAGQEGLVPLVLHIHFSVIRIQNMLLT